MSMRPRLCLLALNVALLGVLGWGGCAANGSGAQSGKPTPRPTVTMTGTQRVAAREASIERLEALALSTEPLWRAHAMEGLRWAPQRAEPLLRAGLVDENAGVRFAAAMTVGRLDLRSLTPQVEALQADPDQNVRMAAVYALAKFGRSPNQQVLASALRSTDPRLRSQAAFVLGEIGEPSAAPMLLEAARQAPNTGTVAERTLFDLQAAEARTKLGDTAAQDAIVSALYPATLEGFEAAVLAAQIIGELNISQATSQLVSIVESRVVAPGESRDWRHQSQTRPYLYPIEMRLAAATSLARMGFRDGGAVAAEGLASPNPLVRSQAAALLAELGRPEDLSQLSALLDSPEPAVQASAAAGMLRALQSGRSRG